MKNYKNIKISDKHKQILENDQYYNNDKYNKHLNLFFDTISKDFKQVNVTNIITDSHISIECDEIIYTVINHNTVNNYYVFRGGLLSHFASDVSGIEAWHEENINLQKTLILL